MKIETQCPNCSSKFKVAEQNVGRKGRCPSCQTVFEVTAATSAPPPRRKKSARTESEVETDIEVDQEQSTTANGLGARNLVIAVVAVIVVVGIGLTTLAGPFFKPSKREPVQIASDSNVVKSRPAESYANESLIPEQPVASTPAAPIEQIAPTEAVKKQREPIDLVFPSKREFRHGFQIIEHKVEGDLFAETLALRADNKMSLIFVDLFFNDPLHNGKNRSLDEIVNLRFLSYLDTWTKLSPDTLHIVIDGDKKNASVRKGERADKVIVTTLPLSFLPKLLNAHTIDIYVGPVKFELLEVHIEGMRDLASRAIDGKTRQGSYIVRHEADSNAAASQTSSSRDEQQIPEAFNDAMALRKSQINDKILKIDVSKSEIKRAKINDDTKAIEKASQSVSALQAEIRKLLDAPLAEDALKLWQLKTGQIGTIANDGLLNVLQIIDKDKGEALIVPKFTRTIPTLKVAGIDVRNLTDGGTFHLEGRNCFIVAGTETYDTVGGGSNTIFRLESCDDTPKFTDAELKGYREAADPNFKIELTAAEEAKLQVARDAKMQANLDKEKLAKSRRSKSNLDSAKLLLKKDERAAAKKFLEKSVAEDPDSEWGKEAAKLLEDLP